ncbi:D-alanyl-D-alanine carboxypeptidase family protein [Altererythrobacter lutimaris]|uniref:D-alanyl-D-alanine carboxypeptidase family protein n=1 Tax=Altererythrobacter lutimaris TaxID=2743979 RepID=UPI001E339843|nr:D-alanyl-D-alanine carboxypeptidase family protein [Altererythrobacter lutimaris]
MPEVRLQSIIFAAVLAFSASVAQAAAGEARIPDATQVPIALMIDMTSSQVLYERQVDRRFVPASITKVMTAYTAFELIKAGELNTNAVYTVRPDTFSKWRRRGSTMFLGLDSKPTVNQLLHGITTVSANDGSVVLAEGAAGSVEAWTDLMNASAQEIGMRNSHFANPNGWMDDGKTFVTARDLGRLAQAMIGRHPELYSTYFGKREYSFNGITQSNHDPLSGTVQGADGIKTGFTYEAGFGFLGTARRQGRRLVMVVGGANSQRIRRDASRDFMEWGFSAFDNRYLFNAGDSVGTARVQNGDAFHVDLVAAGPVRVSVPKAYDGNLDMHIEYEGPLRAPIRTEERVATLIISGERVPEARIPLYAAKPVSTAGPLDRVLNAVLSFFV